MLIQHAQGFGFFPEWRKPGRVVHNCSPSTQRAVGRSGVQGHPQLRSEFKASLDYFETEFLRLSKVKKKN